MNENCRKEVGRDWHTYQCSRKAVRDGYCNQHHPDTVKARQAASDQRYAEQSAADAKRREESAVALLKRLGYLISPPSGA